MEFLRHRPLHVGVSRPNEGEDGTRFSTNIIHTVASHSSRLHTLLLRSEKYSDMVDMLQIFFGFHTPMLSDFHCFVAPFGDIGPVPTHFPTFNAPLRNMMLASLPEFAVIPGVLSSLTSLELHGTREPGILWRQLAPALRAAVNLERLMLAQVDCHKINGGPIVTLPSLRHFTLVYGDHRCGSVARNMDMPSLEALTLMVVGEAELSSFLNSNPKIFDVAVRYKLALRQRSSRRLHLALEKMSSAEFLDLRSSDDDVTDTMVKMASTGVPALPHLHTLLLPPDVPSTKAASIVNGRIGTELTVIIPNPDYDRPYSRWRVRDEGTRALEPSASLYDDGLRGSTKAPPSVPNRHGSPLKFQAKAGSPAHVPEIRDARQEAIWVTQPKSAVGQGSNFVTPLPSPGICLPTQPVARFKKCWTQRSRWRAGPHVQLAEYQRKDIDGYRRQKISSATGVSLDVKASLKSVAVSSLFKSARQWPLYGDPAKRHNDAWSDATRSLGTYDFPRDLQLSLLPSLAKGNSFVYKVRKTGEIFKPFLLGEVASIERIAGETDERKGRPTSLHRIHLKVLHGAIEAAKTHFSNDAVLLTDIILQELKPNTSISHIWVVGEYDESFIFIDCGEHTKFIQGFPEIGHRIMVDVTLHRRDVYHDAQICKAYSLAAHTVEVISYTYLRESGITTELDAGQNVLESIFLGSHPIASRRCETLHVINPSPRMMSSERERHCQRLLARTQFHPSADLSDMQYGRDFRPHLTSVKKGGRYTVYEFQAPDAKWQKIRITGRVVDIRGDVWSTGPYGKGQLLDLLHLGVPTTEDAGETSRSVQQIHVLRDALISERSSAYITNIFPIVVNEWFHNGTPFIGNNGNIPHVNPEVSTIVLGYRRHCGDPDCKRHVSTSAQLSIGQHISTYCTLYRRDTIIGPVPQRHYSIEAGHVLQHEPRIKVEDGADVEPVGQTVSQNPNLFSTYF
ncbi:hypothetical protein B0H11DRAFT_1921449 [Mycena galericulata]|nr:hypothetical protein B0H11DRAFT_1921449 [Mycena galericulata]